MFRWVRCLSTTERAPHGCNCFSFPSTLTPAFRGRFAVSGIPGPAIASLSSSPPRSGQLATGVLRKRPLTSVLTKDAPKSLVGRRTKEPGDFPWRCEWIEGGTEEASKLGITSLGAREKRDLQGDLDLPGPGCPPGQLTLRETRTFQLGKVPHSSKGSGNRGHTLRCRSRHTDLSPHPSPGIPGEGTSTSHSPLASAPHELLCELKTKTHARTYWAYSSPGRLWFPV